MFLFSAVVVISLSGERTLRFDAMDDKEARAQRQLHKLGHLCYILYWASFISSFVSSVGRNPNP